jgi:hypothetical protein
MAYEIHEDGSVWVDGVRCYVAIENGILRAMIRAENKMTFDGAALSVGLRYLNDEGEVATPRSVTITELGPYVITPATHDAEGNETSPAVVDNRYHVNFWIDLARADELLWQQWAPQWTTNGQVASANASEVAYAYNGVELIDPMTVSSPSNVLL